MLLKMNIMGKIMDMMNMMIKVITTLLSTAVLDFVGVKITE